MTSKKNLALVALLFAGAFAASALRADAPSTAGITAEKYPDADAVMVDGFEDSTYFADGTCTTTNEQWVAVLTEKGRREESEISLSYSSRYGSADILAVTITGADGKEEVIDHRATMKEMTDNSSHSETIYDPSNRTIVCSIPGVKVGDLVYVKTCRSVRQARIENTYSDLAVFEWTCPIIRQTYRIRGPKELPLKRKAIRHSLGNVTETEEAQPDGTILYTWTCENSPQAFAEPETPPLYTQLQHVRVSTASDWPEISRWYWNLSQPHFEKTNEAITNQVNAILATCPAGDDDVSRLARIRAIYKWVAQEVRYMGLTMEATSPGYAPHDVSITFDKRYGVCRDKAALLAVMLRIAGFEAFPVLIHGGVKMDPDVPIPYFNHAIAAVRAPQSSAANKDGFILMDPTDEASRDLMPAYLSDKSYLVATPEGETLHTSPVVDPDLNAVRIVSDGALEKDGSVLLSTTVNFLGMNDNVYRTTFLRMKPAERRQAFERIVRGAAPGAELLSLDLTPANLQDTGTPLAARMLVRVPETLMRGKTRDEFTPPLFSRTLGVANWLLRGNTSLPKRRFPLVLSSTACTDESLTIRLNGNVGAPLSLPEDVGIDGAYAFQRRFAVENDVFTARRRLAIGAVEVSPEDYLRMRESIERVEAAERQRPVFGKESDANANIHYRLISRDYHFTSPRSWVVTNVIEKEVLTYDGKKSSAELTFSWNPTWQNVELVSATVSNRNGQVVSVSEKEMNVFDCNWAAAAPRYPASKQLVVNLPSVEIGSVIRYTTVSTVTDAPTAFCATFFADAFEPTDRLVIKIDGLEMEDLNQVAAFDNLTVLKSEPMQPDGRLWRNTETVSAGDFKELAKRLRPATEVGRLDWRTILGEDAAKPEGEAGIVAIRNWMTRHVRLAGPSLYELPVEQQLTDPAVIAAERYATRLDYIRTMTALLRGAGYDADVVFTAGDAKDDPEIVKMNLEAYPDESAFSGALCRVTLREGGFLCFGGTKKTFFIGMENEYTPLGATAFVGSHYLDPASGDIALVTVPDESLRNKAETTYTVRVRENGAADIDVREELWGPGVGAFRKLYSEMLPEDRSRHYQEVLGGIAQAATATQDLVTDTESYPAVRTFSCYVPNYATVANGAITLSLPDFGAHIFPLTGAVRETPIAVGSRDESTTYVEAIFPEGYTLVEQEPESLTVTRPTSGETWYVYGVGANSRPGTATMMRHVAERRASCLDPVWFEHLKALDGRVTSRANRTVTVRKNGK